MMLTFPLMLEERRRKNPNNPGVFFLGAWGIHKGPFNNYVDKMSGGGGQKMSVSVHAQGIKTVHAGGWGQKMAKFCSRSC